ncbi:hypothetical protein QTP70_006210 [Hemibagrus guttatus]|uniref:Tc1-like transposase DDE domain-containing protein n=1 Tax=Hemibagrus guttatus TaxID=175788 RepID=A0AAE0QUA8_9TELE|nr:hypothetical protein QTP70_006210 [Hemibagrus guttatus]
MGSQGSLMHALERKLDYTSRIHYGKKASRRRQCHAFGNVLLGNLGSCNPCDVTLTRTTYLSIVADHVHPFMETVFPHGCGLFQQDNVPCHKAKMVQEWFDEHNNKFEKLRQALGGQVVLPDDWESTAEGIRETGRKVLGVSSGRRKEDKETWWWNEEVQDSIQRKRLAKKKWDMDRTEENRQEYKESQRRVKREVSKAKQKAYDELYTRCESALSNWTMFLSRTNHK